MTGEIRYPCLESFDPSDYMKKIASYLPDSTELYKLSDKETQINEAVLFFENYVNTLPYPKEKNCRTVVRSVDVFEVANDIYGFYFNTNKEYLGVQFDYIKSGTVHSDYEDYSPTMGFGFMVESNDVDIRVPLKTFNFDKNKHCFPLFYVDKKLKNRVFRGCHN